MGRHVRSLVLAVCACVPWLWMRAAGIAPEPPWGFLIPGACIFGAAFLMTWAAEAAEMDLPQSVAIGIVALIAVLPEYAVDMVFAWKGGRDPSYIQFATANMTGANRLLIGIGWPAVLAAYWWKHGRRAVHLTEANAVELTTLLLATVYAFVLPLKGHLSLVDTGVFVALFAAYAWRSTQSEAEEPELEGAAMMIGRLPKARRRAAIAVLFAFAAVAICLSAEPFAEGILAAGRRWGIEDFLLVQWLAPVASEAPEFIVAIVFALKGKAAVAMRALVSSKVNQWTLLIGFLPLVFGLSAGHAAPMPLDSRQVEEIFLTAAQSLFGLTLLMNLEFSIAESAALAALFLGQIAFPTQAARWIFAGAYLASAATLVATGAVRRQRIGGLVRHGVRPKRR